MGIQTVPVTRKNNVVCSLPSYNPEVGKDGLGCYLYEKFRQNAHKIFQIDAATAETESYGSVLERGIRVALKLKTKGISEDDVVATCVENTLDTFIPIFAALLLNAKVTNFDGSLSVRDTVYLLNITKPKIVFVGETGMDLMSEALREGEHKFEVVDMKNSSDNQFSEFLNPQQDEDSFKPKPLLNRDSTAVIFFSSGTTGMPKGICCSGYGLIQSSLNAVKSGLTCKVGTHSSSFYWISAMMTTLMVIIEDGQKIIIPKYNPVTLYQATEKYKITMLFVGTALLNDFSEEEMAKYDLSSVKNFLCAGTSAREDQILQFGIKSEAVIRKNNIVYGLPPTDPELGKDGLGYYLYQKFTQNANEIFQIDATTEEAETYGSVLKRAIRVALTLRSKGITENDIVATCTENTLDTFIPIFAALLLNAKITNFDGSLSIRDTVYLLNMTKPKLIFVGDTGMELMKAALKECEHKFELVTMKNSTQNPFSVFLKPHPNENSFEPKPCAHRDSTTVIFFSSGTTGMPKGICCSGYGLLQGALNAVKVGISSKVGIHVSSFYWISAMTLTLMVIVDDGRKIILPKCNPDTLFHAIQKYKVSMLFAGTALLNDFNEEEMAKYDFNSVKYFICGGSPAREEQLLNFGRYFMEGAFLCSYGQTEAAGFLTTFTLDTINLAKRHLSSVGLPVRGTDIKIVDPETEEVLGINEKGEIRFSSDCKFVGYYGADCTSVFDKNGFVKTGDVGYFNEDNCLFICDRIKDMMKYKDWHVVPASVEKIVYQHPAVKEAVVVGIPHPKDGDHPLACIVLHDKYTDTTEEEIINFVNSRVLDREKLRGGVMFVSKLPRTTTGKVLRSYIRKAIQEGTL